MATQNQYQRTLLCGHEHYEDITIIVLPGVNLRDQPIRLAADSCSHPSGLYSY